jgi:ribosomal protein S6E (S10)
LPYDLGKQTAKSMRAGYASPKAGRRKRKAVRRNLFGNQGEVVDE